MATKRIRVTRVPFNFYWPNVSAVSCINELGPTLVKAEIADAAIAQGYAEPFDPVTKPATRRRKKAIEKPDAAPATNGIDSHRVDREDLADDDSASDIDLVAPAE